MAIATCNGLPIVSGRITLRLAGTWDAELAVTGSDPSKVAGALVLDVGGVGLRATATRAEADQAETVTVRAVGGAGGLGASVPALGYVNVSRRVVLVDALTLGGERLSSTSSADLDALLPHWTRVAGTVGDAVRAQVKSAGLSWRILLDGSVWVGAETWPTVEPKHVLEDERPTADAVSVALDELSVLPGTVFRGKRVREVCYQLDGYALRALVTYGDSPRGELAQLVGDFIKRELPTEGMTVFAARVVGQNTDDSLELVQSDARMPPMSRVPIRPALAGVTRVRVPSGATALVTHENGDPARPVCIGFGAGAATMVEMGSNPEPVALAPALQTYATELEAFLAAVRALLAAPGPVSGSPALPPVPSLSNDVESTELKAT